MQVEVDKSQKEPLCRSSEIPKSPKEKLLLLSESTNNSQNQDNNANLQPSRSQSKREFIRANLPGVLTLIGGFFLELYLGCFFLWGNIAIYVLSYFHEIHPGANYNFIFIVDSMLVFSNWFGYQVGLFFFQKLRWSPKLVIAVGATISLSGVFLSSYTRDLAEYLACYCFMNGIGCGMCYMVPLVCGWEYFPLHKGLVTGLIIGGYGFGSFVFSFVSTALVNPNNLSPTVEDPENSTTYFAPEVADRTPYMLRVLAIIWACLAAIGVLLITRKPREEDNVRNE